MIDAHGIGGVPSQLDGKRQELLLFPFDILHRKHERPRVALLFVEAFLVTIVGTLMAWVIFSAAAGLIAVFLITIGLQETFSVLLDVNRRDIWEQRLTAYRANYALLLSGIALFTGCLAGISVIAWLLQPDMLRQVFASQFQLSPLPALDLTRIDFGSFDRLFRHNLTIFALSLLISIFYRSGGALLILSWNASVWALSYSYVSQSTVALGIGSLQTTAAAVVVGITPHLLLEVAAYVCAAMGGIFFSKGVEKYRLRDAKFRRVMLATAAIVTSGIIILALGAAVEAHWPAYWLPRMFS